MRNLILIFALIASQFSLLTAQDLRNNPNSNHANKFEQLGTILPTPNEYRTASGSPGTKYWQQKADYIIKCTLDEKKQRLMGSENITYHNNSPDALQYLWMQLDENQHSSINNAGYQNEGSLPRSMDDGDLDRMKANKGDNGYGFKITKLTDATGKALKYTINKTMMRIDLPTALKPGEKFVFNLDWNYNIVNRMELGGRGGYEFFPEDGNHLFTMSQWYPRMCVYSDFEGWQNHQFSGRAEFALAFGDFNVEMTVPADHVVCATGECQNYAELLTPAQMGRWKTAQTSTEPIEIVTLAEAKAAETKKASGTKTYKFKAKDVRDFAWGSSRKFVWDALPVDIEGKKVMAMSFYGTLLGFVSTMFLFVILIEEFKFPFIEKFPVPMAKSVFPFNRKRISKEEYSVIPLSKIPS